MGKNKTVVINNPTPEIDPETGEPIETTVVETAEPGFTISYVQEDEDIALTFLDEERRDSEALRLRGMGIVLVKG